MTLAQVCGCTADADDVTPFVSNQKAQFYGVYLSLPDGRYEWQDDHPTKHDALEHAYTLITHGAADALDDRTFDEAL